MSTYTPIASTTLTDPASSVTIGGIPQTYTDLVVVLNGLNSTSTGQDIFIRFNSDTGSNYSFTDLYGNGTTAASTRASNQTAGRLSYFVTPGTTGGFNSIAHIMNYSNTTTNKTVISRANSIGGNTTYPGAEALVNLWRDTSAITSVTITCVSTSFASGSTFTLYGIDAQASAQAKATGGHTIIRDSNYWYHIFNSSGTFTPTEAITADYLVVAGGGGGGSRQHGGGGGAGGMRCTVTATGGGGSVESALSLTAQAYTVTVGAGGAGGSGSSGTTNNSGVQGSNSVFATITSTGGGYGGGYGSTGGNGGSGGGSGGNSSTGGTASPSGQGFNGGGYATANGPGSGGGGAGAVGANASGSYASGTGGAGGNGVATSISGTSTTFAGGGGGGGTSGGTTSGNQGAGGSGGGGAGNGTSGTANLGGGGGGNSSSNTGNGGNGGSGIVIIRYAV